MGIIEQLFLGLALSMDAFAVSICKGLFARDKIKEAVEAGLWFGLAQALMTAAGYFLGMRFLKAIDKFDHLIAFFLLCLIGLSMLKEALTEVEEGDGCKREKKSMFLQALATSIDALAVGVSIALVKTDILSPAVIIGVVTFIMSFIGVFAGRSIGEKNEKMASIAGAIILLLLAFKILIEGLM